MASTTLLYTKKGDPVYKISVSRGRGCSPYTMRWKVPSGWSKRAIERELAKVAATFEADCKAGKIQNREEKRAIEAAKAAEEAKIKTVQQYAELVYLPKFSIRVAEHSRDSYTRMLKLHIFPEIGELKMPEVRPIDISRIFIKMQSKNYAHATLVKVYNITNGLFKDAFMSEMIEKNPMDRVERPKPRKEEKTEEIEYYNAQELIYIRNCVVNEPLKWRAIIQLFIDTGMRKGELLGLSWSDIDFVKQEIKVEKTWNYTKSKGCYLSTPKSRKTRIVSVGDETIALLKELKRESVLDINGDGPIFTKDDDPTVRMFPDSPTAYFRKLGKRFDIPNFHPHILRHSYISVALTHGADIVSVSRNAGHANPAITMRMYSHADSEAAKKAADTFRKALTAARNGEEKVSEKGA